MTILAIPTARQTQSRLRRVAWWVLILLCLIGAVASLRRMVALAHPVSSARVPVLQDLDARFAAKKTLTYVHISVGLIFVCLVPLQFIPSIRTRKPRLHRINGRVLMGLGLVAAVTAIAMTLRSPIGGANEAAATIFFGTFFLFSLGKAFWYIRHGNVVLHREWMIRAVAIALGIGTTRPVMGVFFATMPLTHLTPQQFFGTAFWIGFSLNYTIAEAWLNHTRTPVRRRLASQ